MYTLRIFKDKGEISREQINLGHAYQVKGVDKEDEKLGIKLRIHSSESHVPADGLAIFTDDYAYIMTESGKTFETLNKPK